MGLNSRLNFKDDKKDLLCPIYPKKQDKLDKNSPNWDPVRIPTNPIIFVTLENYEYLLFPLTNCKKGLYSNYEKHQDYQASRIRKKVLWKMGV